MIRKLKVLVGCEESQAVTIELRKLGHEAYSCDILECSGGHPEWHFKKDIFDVLNDKWDMLIAFPPCTHLAVSGAPHFEKKKADGRQKAGIDFFMSMINAPIKRIAVENPIGIMSKIYRSPDQIIQPYYFGDPFNKSTCLWLKNLPLLYHNSTPNLFDENVTHSDTNELEWFYWTCKKTGKIKRQSLWCYEAFKNAKTKEERSTLRSKTFPGIAKAMAKQWSEYVLNND